KYNYIFTYGVDNVFKKISRKNWIITFYPIMIIGSSIYDGPTVRQSLLEKMFNYYIPYNILFIGITALLVALGKGDKN
ncbi:hypothetical protein FCV28_17680, partial [Clostridium botulinum]|nr:hypothetical protein [Clostridium botulinum]